MNLCGSYSPPLAAQPARASELGVLPGEATERRLLSLLLADRVALSGGSGVPGGDEHLHPQKHDVSVLLYHLVFPAKYRRAVIDAAVDQVLREVCLAVEARYQLKFLEIGTDKDHVRFLVQSVPAYSVSRLVTIIKSLTAREIFRRCPEVRKQLWGGEFWTDGYFASTVGRHGNEKAIGAYVKRQGSGYQKLHEARQLALF